MIVRRDLRDDTEWETGEGVHDGALEGCYSPFVNAGQRGEVFEPFRDAR